MIWIFARPLVWQRLNRGNGYDTAYSDDNGTGLGDGTDNCTERVIYGWGTGDGKGDGKRAFYGFGHGDYDNE